MQPCVHTTTSHADLQAFGLSTVDEKRPRISPSEAWRVTLTFKKPEAGGGPDLRHDVSWLRRDVSGDLDSDYPPGPGVEAPLEVDFEWDGDRLRPRRIALRAPVGPLEVP